MPKVGGEQEASPLWSPMNLDVYESEVPLTLQVCPRPRDEEEVEEEGEKAAARGLHGSSREAQSVQQWVSSRKNRLLRDVASDVSLGWLCLGSSAGADGPGNQWGWH